MFTLRRPAARVVLLDHEARIFLMHAEDPVDFRKPPWWEIPGGGISPGESSEDAARRELYEETGITVAEIGPCIWTQHVEFDFAGYHFDSNERIHVAWCDGGDWNPRHDGPDCAARVDVVVEEEHLQPGGAASRGDSPDER